MQMILLGAGCCVVQDGAGAQWCSGQKWSMRCCKAMAAALPVTQYLCEPGAAEAMLCSTACMRTAQCFCWPLYGSVCVSPQIHKCLCRPGAVEAGAVD
jgi:hypothetical protein